MFEPWQPVAIHRAVDPVDARDLGDADGEPPVGPRDVLGDRREALAVRGAEHRRATRDEVPLHQAVEDVAAEDLEPLEVPERVVQQTAVLVDHLHVAEDEPDLRVRVEVPGLRRTLSSGQTSSPSRSAM